MLNQENFTALVKALGENVDIFIWSMADMPRVSSDIITHKLSVSPTSHPVKQKIRNFAFDRSQAINVEIAKLLDANLIHKVNYHDWLANVVLVKKANEK